MKGAKSNPFPMPSDDYWYCLEMRGQLKKQKPAMYISTMLIKSSENKCSLTFKIRYSEKATKIEKISHFVLTLLRY